MTTEARTAPRWLWPLLADLACVLALAAGGKNTHDGDDSWWVVLVIAWPFALAAVLAHVGLTSRGQDVRRLWPGGVTVLAVTYALGMALRAASGRGLATGFLVVAAIFLVVTMLGWRAVAQLLARRRSTPTR
ncbi:DUF3054 domain-containing protein [Nocardioides humilatus]|uniref:DUF3054 domain-containing protein n=1 Tax=Nocardioides humilatus TaxID=2607660 RepID=A0A5B1L9I9_9ACTN|nr:DUF3054 domain-containing protein [Nocardioides humilatus]KAA1416440.1 DUF3054 domain-containing protein [Nocardioides humilatus]